MTRRVLIFAVAGIALLLSACQTPAINDAQSETSPLIIEQREKQLIALTHFQVSGGLGIWTDDETLSARLGWLQAGEKLQLSLSAPLGMGDMVLLDDGQHVTLTRGEQQLATGSTAGLVLQQGLGLQAKVPLDQLGFWVRGLPGQANTVVRDAQGRLSSVRFTDEAGTGWQARFLRYSVFEGVDVPALITASGGAYSVRLLLKNWQTAPTSLVPETIDSNKRLPIPGR